MKTFIFVTIFLLSISSLAQKKCRENMLSFSIVTKSSISLSEKEEKDLELRFKKVIDSINSFSGGLVVNLEDRVNVTIHLTGRNNGGRVDFPASKNRDYHIVMANEYGYYIPSYLPLSREILEIKSSDNFLNEILSNENTSKSGPIRFYRGVLKNEEVVLSHEYGHVIFHEFLRGSVEEYGAYFDIKIDLANTKKSRFDPLIRKYNEIKERVEVSKSEEDLQRLKEVELKIDEVTTEMIGQAYRHPFNRVRSIVSSYNELFADVVAVLQVERSDLFKKVLYPTRLIQLNKKLKRGDFFTSRDFSSSGNKLSRWDYDEGTYGSMSPIRYFLNESVFKRPSYVYNKEVILESLAKAVESQIRRYLEFGPPIMLIEGEEVINLRKVNEDLMDSISIELKKRYWKIQK